MSNLSIEQQLTQSGWAVKSEFLSNRNLDIDAMRKLLLDTEIKAFGEKSLPDLARLEQLGKLVIVQLHRTRNVAASKDNESSSHRSQLYRLVLTDGHVFQNALILPSLRNFNLETPPGTKLRLKPQTKLSNGFYIINDQNCEVLGGNVVDLVQKWKLTKLMGKHVRTLVGERAPPPWVPFGTRLNSSAVDTSQRAMDVAKGQQSNEEDPEFVRLRRAAIDQLINDQGSKVQRFARQDVMKAKNVVKGFQQIQNQRQRPVERATTA